MKRLVVAALAGAALAVAAAGPAAANDAWLWACHGPGGDGLQPALTDASGAGLSPFSFAADAGVTGVGDACAPGGAGGGLTGALPAGPAGQTAAQVTVYVPPDLGLTGVRLVRSTQGFGGEARPDSQQSYDVRTSTGAPLESASLAAPAGDLSGDVTFPAASAPNSGDYVRVEVRCDAGASQPCTGGPVSYDLSALALHVDDSLKPTFALGASGRVAGTANLEVSATDHGTGLALTQALVDGAVVASSSFGGHCTDLSPGSGQVDLSLTADCPTVAPPVKLSFDTQKLQIPDGNHTLVVKVFDAAGNETDETRALEVLNHPDLGNPSATLTVGTSVPGTQASGAAAGGTGGVAGATASSCSRPRLSVVLNQKPLRIRHRVPVLKRGKRYRFRGRLTCVVHNKRVSAPRRTRIDRLDKVGRRTVSKGGALVRSRGRLTFIVPALSSRTLIFRFINGDRRLDVKIKIKVARR